MKYARLFAAAILALGTVALIGAPAFAQDKRADRPGKAAKQGKRAKGPAAEHGRMAKILKELDLTDKQKAELKPILEDRRAQAKAIHEDAKLTPDQKREKMKELAKATHQKIAAILTPEQKVKLKELRKSHEEKGARGAAPAVKKP